MFLFICVLNASLGHTADIFAFFDVRAYCYKHPASTGFTMVPQVFICCTSIFISLKKFFNFPCDFLNNPFFIHGYVAQFPHNCIIYSVYLLLTSDFHYVKKCDDFNFLNLWRRIAYTYLIRSLPLRMSHVLIK